MVRSRFSAGIALLTSAALAVSSVSVAGPLPPVLSADAAKSPSFHSIQGRRDRPERQGRDRQERGDRQDRRERSERQEQPRVDWRQHYYDRRSNRRTGAPERTYRQPAPRHRARGRVAPRRRTVIVKQVPRGPRVAVPRGRRHFYRNVWVVRPHGHWYHGYGHHYHDRDAFPWLAFTAITLSLLTLLTVAQQRAQEQAQIDATTAPVGSTITWNDTNAAGSVSVLREGRSTNGQTCREFQQTVTVGDRSEQAYGTACRQPDGAWRIVNSQ